MKGRATAQPAGLWKQSGGSSRRSEWERDGAEGAEVSESGGTRADLQGGAWGHAALFAGWDQRQRSTLQRPHSETREDVHRGWCVYIRVCVSVCVCACVCCVCLLQCNLKPNSTLLFLWHTELSASLLSLHYLSFTFPFHYDAQLQCCL